MASGNETGCASKSQNDEDDIDLSMTHPSVVDRYYTRTYKTDVKAKGEDHCILVHSNRICIVTLAESHPVLRLKKTVTNVSFEIDKKTNRQNNKVSGKYKRGAQQLKEGSVLCHITCSDDTFYHVCSCLKASLVEVNEKLCDDPHLITTKPHGEGYIAIVLTRLPDHKEQIKKLLSQKQYEEALQKRDSEKKTLLEEEQAECKDDRSDR